MANNKTTTQDNTVNELMVDGRFFMSSYDKKDKDGNKLETVDFVAFELIDPFGDEDFRSVSVKAKWDKYDDKTGRCIRPDRVFELMKYYARKALRTCAEVRIKITIKPVKYKSKRSGEMITYPAMFADPTFAELEEEKLVEVVVKDPAKNITFTHLAGRKLGIKFTPRENPEDEDIGLAN